MSISRDREAVIESALQLSPEDRLILLDRLFDSLPDDLPGLDAESDEFQEELLRRSGDTAGAVPWELLRDELRHPSL